MRFFERPVGFLSAERGDTILHPCLPGCRGRLLVSVFYAEGKELPFKLFSLLVGIPLRTEHGQGLLRVYKYLF